MEWETKKQLGRSEKMLMKVTLPLGYSAYKKKLKKNINVFTVEQMLDAAGINIADQCEEIQKLAHENVSGICRVGSRFTKKCICVQLYEDAVDLMPLAMEKGALFCVTRRPVDGVACVVTDDPGRVYADMCCLYNREDITSIAVLGSIGKTSTKKMVQVACESQKNVLCDAGNDNQLDCVGYIGQHIPKDTEIWIQEVSEDTKGCVEQISKIIKPEIAVITAIDKSHIEEFGSEQGILDEISSVTKHMPEDGVCIISIDEHNTAGLIKDRKTVTVSIGNPDADFCAVDVELNSDGLAFSVVEKSNGKSSHVCLKNVYAKHNITSALYAFAAAMLAGVERKNIVQGLEKYRAGGIRQNVYKAKGVTVYADCYNAVAKSVRSAMDAASQIPVHGKRVAVLGDIAETGNYTLSTHEEIVKIAHESDFDVLIAYGANIQEALSKNKVRDNLEVYTPKIRAELNKTVKKMVKRGDLVLFKASHSVGLEKTLKSSFRFAYMKNLWEYTYPLIKWRFVMLFN